MTLGISVDEAQSGADGIERLRDDDAALDAMAQGGWHIGTDQVLGAG